MIRIERSGEGEVVEISFGNATLRAQPVSEERRALAVEEGQRAMSAFVEAILAPPGVTLPRKAGVPIFYVDVENPTLIIRELDGARQRGKIESGRFAEV